MIDGEKMAGSGEIKEEQRKTEGSSTPELRLSRDDGDFLLNQEHEPLPDGMNAESVLLGI